MIQEKLEHYIIESEGLSGDEAEFVAYGLRQIPLLIISWAVFMILSVLFGKVWQTAIYLVVYMSIRVFAGGFHASTRGRCFMISVILVLSALVQFTFIQIPIKAAVVLTAVLLFFVSTVSPIEDVNKKLDGEEKIHYKKKVIKRCAIWFVLIVVSALFGWTECVNSIMTAVMHMAIVILFGIIKNVVIAQNKVRSVQG